MQVAIVFHSVCGNTWLMAQAAAEALQQQGHTVLLRRVADDDVAQWQSIFEAAREYAADINAIPPAQPDELLSCDALLLGSPTYFGNVSAEMKQFMDATSIFWVSAGLAGKRLGVFSSCSSAVGGAESCLKAMIAYGQHMGMIPVSVPANLHPDYSYSAYGITQCSGPQSLLRPDISVLDGMRAYAWYVCKD